MKKLLLIIPILIIAYLGYNFMHRSFERSIIIDAPTEKVWSQTGNLKNWSKWSAWAEKDPTIKNTYSGTEGAVGFKSSWTSKESGDGSMTATSIKENEELIYTLEFIAPYESVSEGYIRLKEENGKVKVIMGMINEPGLMVSLMNMDKMVGPDFERGLELLKEIVENMSDKQEKDYKVEKGIFSSTKYIGIKFNDFPLEKVTGELFAESYGKLSKLDFEDGDKMPSAIYYKWDMENNTTDMAIVLSIKDAPKNIPEGFEIIEISESECFYIDYYGMYNDMESAHMTLNKYLMDNNLGDNYAGIEEYVTDPSTEPNPKKWLTKISYISL